MTELSSPSASLTASTVLPLRYPPPPAEPPSLSLPAWITVKAHEVPNLPLCLQNSPDPGTDPAGLERRVRSTGGVCSPGLALLFRLTSPPQRAAEGNTGNSISDRPHSCSISNPACTCCPLGLEHSSPGTAPDWLPYAWRTTLKRSPSE